jgi:hypothetical protein
MIAVPQIHGRRSKVKKFLVAGLLVLAAAPAAATAATTTQKVYSDSTSWQSVDTRAPGSFDFVAGPGVAPLGSGSLHLSTPDSTAKVNLGNGLLAGTPLADVDALSYETYRSSASSGSPVQVPSLQIAVTGSSADSASGFTTLVFEPVYNTNQGAILDDTWQSWDAFDGGQGVWWSTKDLTNQPAFTGYRTWDQIVADNPNAVVQGAFINQGSGNPGIDANVDAVTLGASGDSTTYDFEPNSAPASKDDCKNGGWASFHPAFSNQGRCVSSVASGR